MKLSLVTAAVTVAFAATSFAQTPPPKTTPPAQTPAAAAPPAPKAEPPAPFPQDSKIAVINMQQIASQSTVGKDASKKLTELNNKKLAELQDKNKQLQALTTKRDTGGAVLSEAARAQLDKDIEKMQRDIQFDQSNAQAEVTDLNNELQNDFQKRLIPIIESIAKEKGLYLVITDDSSIAYAHPGLNISEEVIKRLDAAPAKKN